MIKGGKGGGGTSREKGGEHKEGPKGRAACVRTERERERERKRRPTLPTGTDMNKEKTRVKVNEGK